ncbi:MAG TPA: crossover junction endodeoxyribonuclease RuvC [Candidatus Cloacimonadota bacterium]|nr:crossover junction endodeoxyribonuclease RuvC [Candidatus Cloacimonadota bacterium]HPT71824.1 crossover junction endodeoxyribonuclease RuvC [Candidatus Cloacimonadota bacterium]
MIIIGIDPGSRFCGYGILQLERRTIVAAGCDVIRMNEKLDLTERLSILYQEIGKVLDTYKPDVVAVESIFYGKNIQSAFTLGHARGVILLAIAERGIRFCEYSPREVKKAVVGNGNASKKQIRYMVQQIIKLKTPPPNEDSADALAIALCHFQRFKIGI